MEKKEKKDQKFYVKISSFMYKGKIYRAKFDKIKKLHYFTIDEKTPAKIIDIISHNSRNSIS